MGFVKWMGHDVAKDKTGIWMKKWWWYSFVWMVDVVLQGAWVLYCINYDKGDESLHLLAFRRDVVNTIFQEYSKKGKLFPSYKGIRNIPSDVCYDGTKHCWMKSERWHIQYLFKHLRWSVLAQTVNGWKLLIGHAKTLHLRCLMGFWLCFSWKTKQV